VAAKVLQQSDAHTLLRFVREQALRIDHPHVLAPASWAADDDKVLFTMELVSGGSLAHLIGDYGPLPPFFVCTLLDQLLSGLAAVHAEGVVHRDIKPANVLLEATGTARPHVRLSDFGISMRKGEPRLTETNFVMGTPGYFAPEQLTGAEPDFPADLFAVGLVALYLLEGRKPDSRALVEHFAAYGTPGAPEGVPEPLWQILAGLLQPDPEARFRTATGARKALTAARELLPRPGTEDEPVEVFDQIGPLPSPFGPSGPLPDPQIVPPTTVPRMNQPLPAPPADPGGAERPGAPAARRLPAPSSSPAASSAPTQLYGTGSSPLSPPVPPSTDQSQQAEQPPQQTPVPDPFAPSAPVPSHPHSLPSGNAGAVDPQQAHTAPVRREQALTRPYTARSRQVPGRSSPASPEQPRRGSHGSHSQRRRPGPPPEVAIPLLLLALVCFAVGIWALTRT
jgi:serine/threonine protein kinase